MREFLERHPKGKVVFVRRERNVSPGVALLVTLGAWAVVVAFLSYMWWLRSRVDIGDLLEAAVLHGWYFTVLPFFVGLFALRFALERPMARYLPLGYIVGDAEVLLCARFRHAIVPLRVGEVTHRDCTIGALDVLSNDARRVRDELAAAMTPSAKQAFAERVQQESYRKA